MKHNLMEYTSLTDSWVKRDVEKLLPHISHEKRKVVMRTFIRAFIPTWEPKATMSWSDACVVGAAFEHVVNDSEECTKPECTPCKVFAQCAP